MVDHPGDMPIQEELASLRAENSSLRARVALLESVIDGIDDAVFAKDRQGRHLLVNAAATRALGRTAEDVIGRTNGEVFPPETARRITDDDRMLMDGGETRTYEEWATAGGVPRLLLTTKGARRDERGEVVGVIGISRDITERRRAEEALRETREFLERLLDHSPASIYATSADGRVRLVNRAWEAMTGMERAGVLGRHVEELVPPDLARRLLDQNRTVVEAGEPYEFEEDFPAPGRPYVLHTVKFPLRDAEGRIEAVGGISFDITARKRAEAEQYRLLQEVETERGRLAEVFHRSPAFMAVLRGPDLVLERANDRFHDIVGPREIGRPIRETMPEIEGQGYFELLDGVYRTGVPFVGTDMLIKFVREPGRTLREFYIDFVYWPLRDADGTASGVLVHGVDMTGHKRAMEELLEARERLGELSRRLIAAQEGERRRLSRELHDVVGQELTLLRMGLRATADAADARAREALALEYGGAVDRLIGQVRDLAFALRPSMLDDLGLVPALRSYAHRVAARAGLELRFAAPSVPWRIPPEVETASFRIAQEALTNVMRHSGARRVDLAIAIEGGDLVVAVRDDGVGFDPSRGPGDAPRGEGLGLLGMRERAALLGGRLEIVATPGGGCTVRAVLPLGHAWASAQV